MRKYKLVIFDLDGTLIDAYRAITSSFNYTMRCLQYPSKSERIIRKAVGWGDEKLLKPFLAERDLLRASSIYRRHHKEALLKGSRLFPKVKAVLRYLKKKGYFLAVASNRPTRFSWILIRHLGLKGYFDYVLCADKLKHGKPHPEILRRIMQKLSSGPQETLYIGDMAIDAMAARNAGAKAAIITTGSSTIAEIKKEAPYRVLRGIGGLVKVL